MPKSREMQLPEHDSVEEVTPAAVHCGRFVLFLLGALVLLIPLAFAWADPANEPYLAAALMGTGLILIWLGFVLPRHIVARLGFWISGILPDDDQ
jgi:VIT1/CCC1 family predicted Fe2+/Mn2+ transporter